jgi:autotransporter-associated beta strand protein
MQAAGVFRANGLRLAVLDPWARPRRSLRRAAAVLLACTCLSGGAAYAQDATWNGSTTDWNTPTNWTPNTVPTNTATFATTGSASVDNASGAVSIGTIDFNAAAQAYTVTIDNAFTVTGTGVVNNSANAQTFLVTSGNSLVFQNASSAGSGTGTGTITYHNSGGTIAFNSASSAGSADFLNSSTGVIRFGNLGGTDTANAGAAIIENGGVAAGTTEFFAHTSAANASIVNEGGGGTIFRDQSTAGNAGITNNIGVTNFGVSGGTDIASAGNAFIGNENGGSTNFFAHTTAGDAFIGTSQFSVVTFSDSSTGGNAQFSVAARGFFDMSGLTDGGMTAGSIAGAGTFFLGGNALTVGSNNMSTTVDGDISDGGLSSTAKGGSLIKVGTGTLTLTNTNTYTGATTIDGGALMVDGSIAASSGVTVNSGGTLEGTGTVSSTTINSGGIFAPGNGTPGASMTVSGSLAFLSGAMYLVQVNPTTASFANVTAGTASLNGTVDAVFAPGSYTQKQFTILASTGGINGTFTALDTFNLPADFTATLSYSANDVFLSLAAAMPTIGLNINQQNVANALNTFFNSGGTLPPNFVSVFGLSGSALANALTQLSGEVATGAEHGASDLMNQFLNLTLDQYVDGRSGTAGGGLLGFAPDQADGLPPDIALAYAGVLKAPPPSHPSPASGGESGWGFEQRWTAWGAGFGGSATTNGNPIVGSNNVTTGTFGYAAGMDYHYSPDTVLGFALAGGGTSWNLAQGLGTGRSDAFLAGIYGVTHQGPIYLAGALAAANNWFATNRIALGDQLTANFQGQSYAGRLEGGYRFAVPAARNAIDITPYAAIQAQNFHTPAYSETDLTSGGFGLSYAAMDGTDTRSELGARFDDPTLVGNIPLVLRARLAWAHDWVSNPALNASFESLPGTSFTVNGAPIPHDSALTSAGAQLFFTPNWSLLAKFDGEFASGSQSYAGTGTIRYTW